LGSICQIGVAKFSDKQLIDEWSTLVDPEDYFSETNVCVHGIEQCTVKGHPKFPEISEQLLTIIDDNLCVCHTHFDRVSICRAFIKYNLNSVELSWLDSSQIVRMVWDDLAYKGYGLKNVCNKIGYEFKHHDALEDAKASGYVLIAALQESPIEERIWKRLINKSTHFEQPVKTGSNRFTFDKEKNVKRDANPEGKLFGEVVVFTGDLVISRSETANLAANIGCRVDLGVTKRTTILVVGDQDVTKLAGHEKSSKQRKAEKLAANGQQIRIIWEKDFIGLVKSANLDGAVHGNTLK